MSEEMSKEVLSAREWMDYYEKLFREKKPVRSTPLSIEGVKEGETSKKVRRDN